MDPLPPSPPPPIDPNGVSFITDYLKNPMFPSKAMVEIDSILVSSLFGQRAKKKENRTHHMQIPSHACIVDEETRDQIYSVFEQGKQNLVFGDPQTYLDATKQMAHTLYHGSSLLKKYGPEGQAILEWCITAYSMVINPESSVKLRVRMGPTNTPGFAIHAVTEIKAGQVIHELVGLMPRDEKAKHSEVSHIGPNSDHNHQSTQAEHILFGPIKFLNHKCSTPNAHYVRFRESSGFYVRAIQDIAPGDEVFVDYGKEWFADEPGGCPCLVCKPDQRGKKRQMEEKDEATIQAEIRECRKAKRKRTKERKRGKKSEGGRPSESH